MDKGISLHKELAMGKGTKEAQGKNVKMEPQGGSIAKKSFKCGGIVMKGKKTKKK